MGEGAEEVVPGGVGHLAVCGDLNDRGCEVSAAEWGARERRK